LLLRLVSISPVAQELSVTAWAFAKLGYDTPAARDVFCEIVDFAIPELIKFSSRDLAMLAWAAGRLRYNPDCFLEAIATEAAPRLGEFTPQGLSNLTWALARCGVAVPALMAPLADEVSERIHTFSVQVKHMNK
jgi:hypothetical protein